MAKGAASSEAAMGWKDRRRVMAAKYGYPCDDYEWVVEQALISLQNDHPFSIRAYRHDRSTSFSHGLRYDFVVDTTHFLSYIIEVDGDQHFRPGYEDSNDIEKWRLANERRWPLLRIPYWQAYTCNAELRHRIASFLVCDRKVWLAAQKRDFRKKLKVRERKRQFAALLELSRQAAEHAADLSAEFD